VTAPSARRVAVAAIHRVGPTAGRDQDLVAVEAPVAVHLHQPGHAVARAFGILMRTPGDDRDLVLGLLHAEGVIRAADDVLDVRLDAPADEPARIDVTVAAHVDLDVVTADRVQTATSACGLCGRLSVARLDALAGLALPPGEPGFRAATIASFPGHLREHQTVFAETGGLHAAGLFDRTGALLALREDVGRHNAVDKLVGAALDAGWLPAREAALAVSGRVAFEIVLKAARAGVAVIVAVGAPSSLAIDAARAAGLTLIGFARDGRFNVYTGAGRIRALPD
jgi:FdhD protein